MTDITNSVPQEPVLESSPPETDDNNNEEREKAAEQEEELFRLRKELVVMKEKDDALRLQSFENEESATRKATSHTEKEDRAELRIQFLTERPAVVEQIPAMPPPTSQSDFYPLEVGALRETEPQREFNLFSSENPLFSHPQFVQQDQDYGSVSDSEEPPPLQDDDRDDNNNAITTLLNSFLTADQPTPTNRLPGSDPWGQ